MKKKIKVIFQILFVLTILLLFFSMNYIIEEPYKYISVNSEESSNTDDSSNEENKEKSYIKWVEFNITFEALDRAAKLDISSHVNNEEVKLNWIEILAYISTKYGGDFKKYKAKDIDELVEKLRNGETIENLTKDMKNYSYFYESIEAVLGQYIGNYSIEEENENSEKSFVQKYGIKVFSPIAKGYSYNHYDDFGASRSYGYKRRHLGHDIMGSIGTPIIAVESGIVEVAGWNQYGGWRIGIRSFDRKRYYYYAHLRKDHPFAKDLYEGKTVEAGDVIGYLGMTGYSVKENVNNIDVPHLHFGVQLIFDESQKEGTNQIWIDLYNITKFLSKNKSEVYLKYPDTKDYERKINTIDGNNWD